MNPNTTSTEPFTPASCSAPGSTQEVQKPGSVSSCQTPIYPDSPEVKNLLLTLGVYCLAAEARFFEQMNLNMLNPELRGKILLYTLPYPDSNMPQAQVSILEDRCQGLSVAAELTHQTSAAVEMAIPSGIVEYALLQIPDGYDRFPVEAPCSILRSLAAEYQKEKVSLPVIRELVASSYGVDILAEPTSSPAGAPKA